MANNLYYQKIPEELKKSEETWYRIFTNASLIATGVGLGIGVLCYLVLRGIGLAALGICCIVFFSVGMYLLFTIRIRDRNLTGGAGYTLAQKWLYYRVHKKRGAVYLPNSEELGNHDEDEDIQPD